MADWGFGVLLTAGPAALGLGRAIRAQSAGLAAVQGTVNALTDTPVGLKPVLSLRTHGWLELASGPAVIAVPMMTGAVRDPRDRAFWLSALALLITTYTLTDWEAPPDS